MKITPLIIPLIIISSTVFSQSLFEYKRERNDQGSAYSIVNNKLDSYISAGTEDGIPVFVQLDLDGNEIWRRYYFTSGSELSTIVGTSDSCIVASCYNAGKKTISLIKINNNGDSLWTNIYNLNKSYLQVNCIKETYDNGLIITGTQFDDDFHDIFIWKFDSNGDSLWYNAYPGTDNEWGESISVSSDSSYVISGMKWFKTDDRGRDVYLLKVDSVGVLLWDTVFAVKYEDYARSVIVNSEDDIILGATFDRKPTLCKFSEQGTLIWKKDYLKIDEGYINEIIETSLGYAITGYTQNARLFAISTNFYGDILWEKVLYEAGHSYGESLCESSNNSLVIAGVINSANFGNPDYDFYVINFSSEGNHIFTTIENQKLDKLFRIYPIPVNEILNIDYNADDYKTISYTILDLSGKVVLKGSSNEINVEDLKNGTYLIKIVSEKGLISRKFIKTN